LYVRVLCDLWHFLTILTGHLLASEVCVKAVYA
jgi:hypothetical protein